MNACTKAGTHSIHISEKIKGNAPLRYYTVYAGPLNKILLIGHDGVIQTVPVKNGNYLNYGNSPKGDFIIKPNLKLVLDFDMIDQYGNKVTVNSPGTLFNLKKVIQGLAIKTFGFPPKFFILDSISPKALATYNIKK